MGNKQEAMHRLPPDKRIYLQPGEHRAVDEPMILSTLLGSCISACLYDPFARVSGMNHFLLANRRYARNMPVSHTEAGRYGIHSMELLINDLLKLGADKARLRAKVFGGSSFSTNAGEDILMCVGEVNQRFIREFLALERIPVEAEDTGGTLGRVIHFHTDTFTVWRRYIKSSRLDEEITKEEHEAWSQGVAEAGKEGDAILFL